MLAATACGLALVFASASACARADPRDELEVRQLETYWAVDRVVGGQVYLAPCVRLRVRNKGTTPHTHVDLRAAFKRQGENDTWGSGYQLLATREPLAPGHEAEATLTSDAAYHSATDQPASMFQHEAFRDARVEVFVKLPGSRHARVAEVVVERRVGSARLDAAGP